MFGREGEYNTTTCRQIYLFPFLSFFGFIHFFFLFLFDSFASYFGINYSRSLKL